MVNTSKIVTRISEMANAASVKGVRGGGTPG